MIKGRGEIYDTVRGITGIKPEALIAHISVSYAWNIKIDILDGNRRAGAIVYIPGKAGQGYYVQLTTGFCVHVFSNLSSSTNVPHLFYATPVPSAPPRHPPPCPPPPPPCPPPPLRRHRPGCWPAPLHAQPDS